MNWTLTSRSLPLCAVVLVMGVLSTGTGSGAIAAEESYGSGAIARNDSIPRSLENSLRQDLSRRIGVSPGKLRVVESSRKTWSDGCFELARNNESCTQSTVEGWRVVLSDGDRRWAYRTDRQGRTYRLESPRSRRTSFQPTRIPTDELPALQQGVLFRAISSGGFAGRSYQTVLLRDGRLLRSRLNSDIDSAQEVRRLSRQELSQFRQVLQRSQLSQFDRLSYPARSGSADFITVTLSAASGTVRYADSVQDQLPRSLQELIETWSEIASSN